ncbi:MAG: DUF4143 domain-containing protein [Chloroflexota bacterium]
MDYRRRAIDSELDALLPDLAAIAIRGARGVGKTETALQRARTVYRLDDSAVREIVAASPARLCEGESPILIDEWQAFPSSWDVVRRAVDADRSPGRFLLTGSASPRNPPTHTGAGRIVQLRMRPMTFAERGLERPTVSLAGLLSGSTSAVGGRTATRVDGYADAILSSGFPGVLGLPDRAIKAQLDGYVDQLVERDFEEAGESIRRPALLRRWIAAYAAAISSVTSFEKIRIAASGTGGDPPAKATAQRYVDVLESTWVIDPIPAWAPTGGELRRLALSPKHQLVDPALAARLRRVTIDALLRGQPAGDLNPRHLTLFGALFEAAVTMNVRVDAQAAGGSAFHFRERNGTHEVDLVVEGPDGRIVAIEVKATQAVGDADVRHLVWLRERIGERLAAAVIVTTGPEAYRRRDGVDVVPAALLGP